MHDAVQLQLANYVVCSYNGGDEDKQYYGSSGALPLWLCR